jgi:hypothetical protein
MLIKILQKYRNDHYAYEKMLSFTHININMNYIIVRYVSYLSNLRNFSSLISYPAAKDLGRRALSYISAGKAKRHKT